MSHADRFRGFATSIVALSLFMTVETGTTSDSDVVISGPIVTSSQAEADPGDRTVLTIDGFVSPYVTISICGNEARRGSADCNMAESEGVEVSDDAPLALQMPVAVPPVDCPCVVRVVGQDANEVALTPIVVVGHPVGPLVDPPNFGDLVAVSIRATETPDGVLGALRADLGGPTTYEVTVRVRNLATMPLKQVRISASAGRGEADDSLVSLDLEDPGLIGVGQTWQQTVTVEVPAPAFGTTEWHAAASGAGPAVLATSTSKHRPWLLIALVMVVVFNIALLLIRWRIRSHGARDQKTAIAAASAGPAVDTGRTAVDHAARETVSTAPMPSG